MYIFFSANGKPLAVNFSVLMFVENVLIYFDADYRSPTVILHILSVFRAIVVLSFESTNLA